LTENQRVIAGRYEVGNLIGRGGMADVYEGIDTRLGRTVAIKLLKSDLANDPAFEARFRQEAQASARMGHPTIVRIYDAGEEITTDEYGNPHKYPFIVMEYVKGQLLRDLLHERRLTRQEAIEWTSGVLTALEFSHRAGVIHRDIKSANIMITDGGLVKVMDFGIARAISDSSATQAHTSGIVGTAQYFSPEQAKGENVDARTDLYSTGVLLYEMLCGRPPFKGESAVSVAYQHVSEAVIPPSQFDSSISAELDAVVLRGLAKDREERFQTAEEFREHLIAAANGSPATIAPPVAAPNATTTSWSLDTEDDFDELLGQKSAKTTTFDFKNILDKAKETAATVKETVVDYTGYEKPTSRADVAWEDLRTPATNPFSTLGVDLPTNTGSTQAPLLDGINRPSRGIIVTAVSAASVVLIGLIVWLTAFGNFNLNINPGGNGIAVPNVVGQTYTDGYSQLTAAGLLVSKSAEPSDTVAVDTIIRTDPPAGTSVGDRQVITVYVSGGANTVKVPSLAGLSEAEASGVLATLKLTLGTITQGNSATVAAGKVVETLPTLNTEVPEGSAVNLIISNGKVMVPDVRNLNISEARNAMSAPAVGLPVSITTKTECTGAQGTIVVDQSIQPGLAPQGSAIILYVGCAQ
jgi:serine/threonine protein kinase/beta-lactam-binding protein with PASTA domain